MGRLKKKTKFVRKAKRRNQRCNNSKSYDSLLIINLFKLFMISNVNIYINMTFKLKERYNN